MQDEERTSEFSPSMLKCCIQKLSNADDSKLRFFACTDKPRPLINEVSQTTPTDQEFSQALENISEKVGSPNLTEQDKRIVYDYLFYNNERFFSTLWGEAIFDSNTELWKDYNKVYIEEIPLKIYYQKPNPSSEPQLRSKMFQDVFINDEEKYKTYPAAVSRMPFQATLSPGQWAIISPIYPALVQTLEELKRTYPINEEIAVRQLLAGNANFRVLVDWVHSFQVRVNGQQYHSKEKIMDIYLNWVLFYYHQPESGKK